MASQGDTSKGLFASLFDFNFTSFITLKFLKVIYGLLMAVVLLIGVIMFFSFLVKGGIGGVFFAIIIVPIATLLYLIFVRVYLESLALFFRIGENTQAIRQSLGGSGGPSGFGAYPTPPTPPPTPPQGAPSWQQPSVQPQPQQPPASEWSQPASPSQQPPTSPPGFPPPGA